MKLLQINKLYYPVIGGIETVVKNITESLKSDVLACELKGGRTLTEIDGQKIYKAASYGKKLGMPLSFDFFLLFFQLRKNYDAFLLHFPFPLATLITPFIPKQKLFIYYHCDIVRQKFFRFIFTPFIRYSLKRAHLIMVSGQNIINSSSFLKSFADKCQIVPFGMKIEYSDSDHQEAKKIKARYGNKNLLLAVGRLVYYKGYEYAIRAMVGIDAHLLIIGQGPEEKNLKTLIKELGLENKITIIPPQAVLAPYFLACDIFLFPSSEPSEAFGLVQLEAMAAGKPVINTYLNTAVEEVSINEVTGLTVPAKDAEALHEAIQKLLTNNDLLRKYGDNALKRYQELYTLEKFTEKIKETLEA